MKLFQFLLFAGAAAFMFTSCDNDDDDDSKAAVELHIEYAVGDESFSYGQDYTIGGTVVNFEFVQFYIHDVQLEAADGSAFDFGDLHFLVSPEEPHYELGEVDPGMFSKVSFDIGVDPAANSQTEDDFTQRADDDPLAMQSPEPMHWNWNAGYIFVKINGNTDTDGDGVAEERMEFHIGTDNLLRALSFETSTELKGGENEFEFEFDLAELFANIDLSTEYDCHTGDAPELAERFANSLQDAFNVE